MAPFRPIADIGQARISPGMEAREALRRTLTGPALLNVPEQVAVLWAAVFLVASVIYRPVEQLLSRTISARRPRRRGSRSGGRETR